MNSLGISEIFSEFDTYEKASISMLIDMVYGSNSQNDCDDTIKVVMLIERLRVSIEQIKPSDLPFSLRLRRKRFLFLASQGLEMIAKITKSELIKELISRENNYINAKFRSFDDYDYDSSKIILCGERYLKIYDEMLESVKEYNLYDFKCACAK